MGVLTVKFVSINQVNVSRNRVFGHHIFGHQPLNRTEVIYVIKQTHNPVLLSLSSSYSEGSNLTPAHHHGDFRFKTYAPIAFRYFRELFGIRPDDYLVS